VVVASIPTAPVADFGQEVKRGEELLAKWKGKKGRW
jgi:hypothetical protein